MLITIVYVCAFYINYICVLWRSLRNVHVRVFIRDLETFSNFIGVEILQI